ncbi:MAG TPA: hypothetical protein VGJ87_08420 [Roseiflexaceae bacterium]|jgi:hypothetical protein
MNEWLTPMCQWPATEDGTAFGFTCAVLATLLLAGIAWFLATARLARDGYRAPPIRTPFYE